MFSGSFFDVVYKKRNHKDIEVYRSISWVKNVECVKSGIVLASLFKGDSLLQGIQYHAFGKGTHTKRPSSQSEVLVQEVFRKKPTDIYYIDAMGVISVAPTNIVIIKTVLDYSEIPSATNLTEHGLFGGNAIGVLNSGLLLNIAVHPVLYKDITLKLIRFYKIQF